MNPKAYIQHIFIVCFYEPDTKLGSQTGIREWSRFTDVTIP